MKQGIIADFKPSQVIPALKTALNIINNSGCYCWVNLAHGWDKKDLTETKVILDDRGANYTIYDSKTMADWKTFNFADKITPHTVSAYFYIFNNDLSVYDIIPVVNRMRSLFKLANSSNDNAKRPKYKGQTDRDDIKSWDSQIIEDISPDGIYYRMRNVRVACIRISGHGSTDFKLKKFHERQFYPNNNTITYFDPSTDEELMHNLYDAIKYVKGNLSNNFTKKAEAKRFDKLLARIKIFRDLDTLDSKFPFDWENYFGVENAYIRYIKDLEVALYNITGQLDSCKSMFKDSATVAKIKELEDKKAHIVSNLDWMETNMETYLIPLAEEISHRAETAFADIEAKYSDNPEYSSYFTYLSKEQAMQDITNLYRDKRDGKIDPKVADDLIKYLQIYQIRGDLKRTIKQSTKRMRQILSSKMPSNASKKLDMMEYLDAIL